MNWWLIIQLGQWLAQLDTIPEPYRLGDEAFFAKPSSHLAMALDKPDTLLLDVSLFQATNEARRAAGVAPLQYDPGLGQAATAHAQSMIRYDYVGHDDLYQLDELTLLRRVRKRTTRFGRLAENVGQYQTIDTDEWYGVRYNTRRQQYEYVNSANQRLYEPYSYAQYARYAVQQWLASAHHRANLLNPQFTHVGCAGRLSAHPYGQRRAPFGRLVQDFGALPVATAVSR